MRRQIQYDFSDKNHPRDSAITEYTDGMHGDFIIYVDESGESQPSPTDINHPVFVLAFCIFNKSVYAEKITPRIQQFKFKYFGHDMVVLHEREIRKSKPPFQFLVDEKQRIPFFDDLNSILEDASFHIVAAAICKNRIKPSDVVGDNLYHVALQMGLESVNRVLNEQSQLGQFTHFVFESRGKKEDKELELEFRRICDGDNSTRSRFPFEFIVASKQINSCGLQLADLVARPIGRYLLNPSQPNRAFEILKKKFWTPGDAEEEKDWSLHVYP